MAKIKIGLIGSGWRAAFFIRIAKALPETFELTSVLVRSAEKGAAFSKEFGVKVVNSVDDMMKDAPDYVILSIKRGTISGVLLDLFQRGIPVLCETPPGETVEELEVIWQSCKQHGAKVQVAEQYVAQPLYAAWLNVAESGQIGEISNIQLSALHGYHGISIIRRFLKAGFENCFISGKRFDFPAVKTAGREGMIQSGETVFYSRDRLTLEFDSGKVAFFDFSPVQYHSFIRTRQLTVQGTHGEIDDLTLRYVTDAFLPVTQELRRIDHGPYDNKDWAHWGMMLGEHVVFENPFPGARFNDDEIAIATCMQKMADYVRTGAEFYSLQEALQDTYLSLMMDEALRQPNKEIKTSSSKWAEGHIFPAGNE